MRLHGVKVLIAHLRPRHRYMPRRLNEGATVPRMIGHRLMGTSLLFTGEFAQSRPHFDKAIALYDPVEHKPLAMRFGQDLGVPILCNRSWAWWYLGYPNAALVDADCALKLARELDHASTLMFALLVSWTNILTGNYAKAKANVEELSALSDQKVRHFGKHKE
jgi:hypothetical protein